VGDLITRLQAEDVLDSTYIMFLSDNGFFLGEHRQPNGKDAPYDPATLVPLVVRGPDVVAGLKVDQIALNIDLLPTIADLAGLRPPSFVDGRSLRPLLRGEAPAWRDVALLEGFGKETESNDAGEPPTPAFRALRSGDVLYVEYETGERELYNVRRDPAQLVNLAGETPRTSLRTYSSRLDALAGCAVQVCQQLEDEPIPAPPKTSPRGPHKKKQAAQHKKKKQAHKLEATRHKHRQASHKRGQAKHRR
jgi:N-acetylglucosamine-6-sulfatase